MRVMKVVVGLGAVCGLLAAGCSSSSKPATVPPATSPPTSVASSTSTPAASAPASSLASIGPASANGMTVSLARGPQGIFLIGPNGHSLYVFDSDHGTTSACTAGCAP